MMSWLRGSWRWATLNLVALAVMAHMLLMLERVGSSMDFEPLVESAKWAVRFLLFSLAMTPLNTLFGWRYAVKLRKPAGLWAFAFGVLHLACYVFDRQSDWLHFPIPNYAAALGLVVLGILAAMAATSNRWAMRRLGKWWKRLHRLVYAAGVIALVHGLLESQISKRVFVYDSNTDDELWLYVIVLSALLAARIPPVRVFIASLKHRRGRQPSLDASG